MPARLLAAAVWVVLLAASSLVGKPLPEALKRDKQPYFISLLPQANMKLTAALGSGIEGNNLADLPTGERSFAKKTFKIEDGLIHLSGARIRNKPVTVEGIKVNRRFATLNILHGTGFGAEAQEGGPNFIEDETLIGKYKIHYGDKTTASIPIVYGRDVRDWLDRDKSRGVTRGILAWQGSNEFAKQFDAKLRLYITTWENPHPGKLITHIDYRSMNTVCSPFRIAMTAE